MFYFVFVYYCILLDFILNAVELLVSNNIEIAWDRSIDLLILICWVFFFIISCCFSASCFLLVVVLFWFDLIELSIWFDLIWFMDLNLNLNFSGKKRTRKRKSLLNKKQQHILFNWYNFFFLCANKIVIHSIEIFSRQINYFYFSVLYLYLYLYCVVELYLLQI